MTLEELVEKIKGASWDGILFKYQTAEGKADFDKRRAFYREQPKATITGTPKPQRIPYRLENIEEAQIETNGQN